MDTNAREEIYLHSVGDVDDETASCEEIVLLNNDHITEL